MWEINKDPVRVRICRIKHLSNYGFGAGRFAGWCGGCTFAEISHCGCGLCAVQCSRGMEDGGRQKVYGAGSCWNNTWEPEDTGVNTSSSLSINNHGIWRCHTSEMGAHTKSVGRGAGKFRPGGQVRVSQSLILKAGCDLTGGVAPYSSAANRARICVILSHRGQQQGDIVAFWSYHRVFGQRICRFGPR